MAKTITVKFDVTDLPEYVVDNLLDALTVQGEDLNGPTPEEYEVYQATCTLAIIESTHTCTLCHTEKSSDQFMTETVCIKCA